LRVLGTVFNGDQRRQERGSECAAEVAGHIEGLREEETTMEDRSPGGTNHGAARPTVVVNNLFVYHPVPTVNWSSSRCVNRRSRQPVDLWMAGAAQIGLPSARAHNSIGITTVLSINELNPQISKAAHLPTSMVLLCSGLRSVFFRRESCG
jgi:hypothetical protein